MLLGLRIANSVHTLWDMQWTHILNVTWHISLGIHAKEWIICHCLLLSCLHRLPYYIVVA